MAEGVRYAIVPCSLGRLLVAWTERGVCDVALGDVDDALRDPLGPDAVPGRSPWVDAVRAEVDGRSTADVPLDLHGTPFQRRVWAALRRILQAFDAACSPAPKDEDTVKARLWYDTPTYPLSPSL